MQNRRETLAQQRHRGRRCWPAAGLLPAVRAGRLEQGRLRDQEHGRRGEGLGGGAPVESKDITITAPDIAENGAVVPVGVVDHAARRRSDLLMLVEKNPNMLAAMFDVTDGDRAERQRRASRWARRPTSTRWRSRPTARCYYAPEGNQGHARRLRRLTGPTHQTRSTTWQIRCASAPSRRRQRPTCAC